MTNIGYILLEGGAEFNGKMSDPDRQAICLAGGPDARITIIPAAAAPDNNHQRAGQNGVRWFHRLGATNVTALPLIDRASAKDPEVVRILSESCLIYLLGGFPHYLNQVLSNSAGWRAMLGTYRTGSIIAGSSAGAMVLCDYFCDPVSGEVIRGLGLVVGACVIPHHDTFGQDWVPRLRQQLPNITLIGIDEQTGMLNECSQNRWRIYGKGSVTLYRDGKIDHYGPGQVFALNMA